jgi:hypothetical protein
VWAPGDVLAFDWGEIGPLFVFCAVLAWSRWRFVFFADNLGSDATLAGLAACFEELGGVPKTALTDRMGCLKGGTVAGVVVPTADYVRFATHYGFRPDFCEGQDPESGRLREVGPDDPCRCTRCGVGIDWVGLALIAAGLSIRAVDLDNGDTLSGQEPGQPGAIGTGALDPGQGYRPELVRPGEQRLEPGHRGVEAGLSEVTTKRVDHPRDMDLSMGVDPDGHAERVDRDAGVCDDGHRGPLVVMNGWAARASNRMDKTVMGA